MKPRTWLPVEVKGRVVHFPHRDPDPAKYELVFKSPEEEAFWRTNPRELAVAMGKLSLMDMHPIQSPFIRLLPQRPPPDVSGRALTMRAVAHYLNIPSPRAALKFLRKNGLRPGKVGRRFFIGKEELEAFILERVKSPDPRAEYRVPVRAGGDRDAATLRALDRHAPRKERHGAEA